LPSSNDGDDEMKKLALISLMFCVGAQAQIFYNGNDLYDGLKNGADSFNRTASEAYIAGVSDSFNKDAFCIPLGIQLGQSRDIVKAHLEANPHLRHLVGSLHVVVALQRVWPCPKKGQL